MIYHGIDIIEIARIRRAVERWGTRFLNRVYTEGELNDCAAGGVMPHYQSLAVRWAAKEATAKALGVGLSGVAATPAFSERPGMTDIEVIREVGGKPCIRLHGAAAIAAANLGITSLALSLSHSGGNALASIVALASEG